MKQLVKEDVYTEWNRRWQTLFTCRQTFEFYPCIDEAKSKKIIKLNPFNMGILIRHTTGHAHLRRHNKIANTMQPKQITNPMPRYSLQDPDDNHTGQYNDDITCRLCQLKGTEETPFHLLQSCLATWETRRELLGSYTFEGERIITWEPMALVRFYKKFDLENKPS